MSGQDDIGQRRAWPVIKHGVSQLGLAGLAIGLSALAARAQADMPQASGAGNWAISAIALLAAVAGAVIWRGRRTKSRRPGPERSAQVDAGADAWTERAVDLVGMAIFVWDPARHTGIYCNESAADLYGQSADVFLAGPFGPDAALSNVEAEDRAALHAAYAAAKAGQGGTVEFRLRRGGGVRRVQESIHPVTDLGGSVIRILCAAVDVTDMLKTGRSGAEAERMQSLGRLTSGIAHDFNNILSVVLGNLELMEEVSNNEERAEMMREAIAATERGRDLTRTMLGYAQRTPAQLRPVDMNDVVREMAPLLRRTMPENISIDYVLHDGARPIVGDRSLADSALLNLALNARDAMPAGGQLRISTLEDSGRKSGPCTVLLVEDTGTGIDPAVQARLFDPFVSSKGPHQNSGLGLAMVQSFVRQAGGEVEAKSRPGVGSSFRLYFPSVDSATMGRRLETGGARAAPGRPARILLVEDNDGVREVVARQLRRAGHSVEAVSDGDAGERAFAEMGPFELLLADLVIPGAVQGSDLADRLLRKCPALRVLFVSGYGRPETGLKHPFLQKPLRRQDLLHAVSMALTN